MKADDAISGMQRCEGLCCDKGSAAMNSTGQQPRTQKRAGRFLKPVLIALGCVAMCLGAVGVALPVLPTTPFLLLAAFCFARGSERFHRWFMATRLYKKHLEGFVHTRAMTLRAKVAICAPATAMLVAAACFAPVWHARVAILIVLALKYYIFLFKIKTIKPTKPSKPI